MVRGIESFKKWFSTNDSQYVIIGGTACDILMNHYGLDFRSTKDIGIKQYTKSQILDDLENMFILEINQ